MTDNLKKSERTEKADVPQDPVSQNQRLTDLLLTTVWGERDIHTIERIEKVNPASASKGWRIWFAES